MRTLKRACSILSFLFLLMPLTALGQKLNLDLGYYNISAAAPGDQSSAGVKLSNIGSYSVSANFELRNPFEIGVGYTVFLSKTYTGDMGFGPDFYLYYFPVNAGGGTKLEMQGIQYREKEEWRPYAYASFHQRQFQSVQSSYSGFGFGAGMEYQWTPQLGLRATLRSMELAGPVNAKFSYFDVLLGVQIYF